MLKATCTPHRNHVNYTLFSQAFITKSYFPTVTKKEKVSIANHLLSGPRHWISKVWELGIYWDLYFYLIFAYDMHSFLNWEISFLNLLQTWTRKHVAHYWVAKLRVESKSDAIFWTPKITHVHNAYKLKQVYVHMHKTYTYKSMFLF